MVSDIADDPATRLTVVIPALNEAEAIGDTVRRCLNARTHIVAGTGVTDIELIVVSDGSTDDTASIAREFAGVEVIEFISNRGYGAAIKSGIQQGTGDLVGFLDADGTCDPLFFSELCRAIEEHDADIALGSRMSKESRMPWTRTIGNRLYAMLLSLLSNQHVTDTASGMRVMRRDCLRALGPLPDGLHYTPAMSARAVLKGMTVAEIPMPYADRVGQSKLRVFRDGWRFLLAILDGVFLFRPERSFMFLAFLTLVPAVLLSLNPVEFYLMNRRVEEWMIYRFVVTFLLGSAGVLALSGAAVVSRMSELVLTRGKRTFWLSLLVRSFGGAPVAILLTALVGGATALIWPGLVEYAQTGHVTLHWSRVIVGAFGLLVAFQVVLTGVLLRTTTLWLEFAVTGDRDPAA